MRIAFISDIHGNGTALRVVLESIEERGVDRIVCLGDICYGGPEPGECLRLVMERADCCVLGNTDAALMECCRTENRGLRAAEETVEWAAESLGKEELTYLGSLPLAIEVHIGEFDIIAFHGSISSYNGTFKIEDLISQAQSDTRSVVYVGGHTHKPCLAYEGTKALLNPGSVGLTTLKTGGVKRNLPLAHYVVADIADRMTVELVQLRFDLTGLRRSLLASAIPNRDHLLTRWDLGQ